VSARVVLVGLLVLAGGGCYLGGGLGGVFPIGGPSRPGGVAVMEAGFQYDYKRQVRVMVLGSGQMGGGAGFVAGDRAVVAPFGNGFALDVTLRRWSNDLLLRLAARAWPFNQEIAIGPLDGEAVPQPGSRVRTAFVGLNLHAISADPQIDPLGISLMAGALVQRLSAPELEVNWSVAPVLMVGCDWSWQLLRCWFVDDRCTHHLLRAKN
jgi:hypothetical protein